MKNLFVANWKMHGSLPFIRDWAKKTALQALDSDVAVCPPLPYLAALRALLPAPVMLGAQTVAASADDGAYTGEVSARMLAEAGCTLVIIGHSERRARQHEDDALCAAKLAAAATAGLRPILCVGEHATIRDNGGTAAATAAVLAQLDAALAAAGDDIWQRLIIAYEPVWAIGSGKTPTINDINALHSAIRAHLIKKTAAFGDKITLLYGGSVNSTNAKAFIGIENVNGFLVGGASLKPQEFNTICNSLTSL